MIVYFLFSELHIVHTLLALQNEFLALGISVNFRRSHLKYDIKAFVLDEQSTALKSQYRMKKIEVFINFIIDKDTTKFMSKVRRCERNETFILRTEKVLKCFFYKME